MALPTININFSNILRGGPEDGILINKYSPFFNLKIKEPINKIDLGPLRVRAAAANLSIDAPIDIDRHQYSEKRELSMKDTLRTGDLRYAADVVPETFSDRL